MPIDLRALADLGGTLGSVVVFIFYLTRRDKDYNEVIQNHMKRSTEVFDKAADANIEVAKQLQRLGDVVSETSRESRSAYKTLARNRNRSQEIAS